MGIKMSDTPRRKPPAAPKRYYSRPDPDWTEQEIEAWAEEFVDAVLGVERPS